MPSRVSSSSQDNISWETEVEFLLAEWEMRFGILGREGFLDRCRAFPSRSLVLPLLSIRNGSVAGFGCLLTIGWDSDGASLCNWG